MRVFLKSNVCRKLFMPFLFVLLSTSFVWAQQTTTISGVVTDNTTGRGLVGATVIVQGTKNGTATKDDGSFSITVPKGNAVLRFSFLGYITKDIPVNGTSTKLNVELLPNQKSLNEVVVVGYGSQNKKDVTGSVTKLDASKFEERPLSNVAQAMQGQMAGVQVRATTGAPGSDLQIKVRGTASVNSGSDPLYVVDGVPIDDLGDINPTDIASIVVLKDAASTAIYGSRATNGVVLITTKKGKSGKTRFNFNAYYGIQQLANKMDLLSGPECIDMYQQVQDSAYVKRGLQSGLNWSASDPISVRQANLKTQKSATYISDPRWALGTDSLSYIDWQDEFYRNAPIANYQLSASGGTDKLTYRVSGNYLDQDGIATATNYKLFSV